jgi:hypothetical protein
MQMKHRLEKAEYVSKEVEHLCRLCGDESMSGCDRASTMCGGKILPAKNQDGERDQSQ